MELCETVVKRLLPSARSLFVHARARLAAGGLAHRHRPLVEVVGALDELTERLAKMKAPRPSGRRSARWGDIAVWPFAIDQASNCRADQVFQTACLNR